MRVELTCGIAVSLMLSASRVSAQAQPATIPTVVARAMFFEPAMFGAPQFFDGRTPPDWPRALVPSGARIIGGGVIGDSGMFRMRTAVFALPAQSNAGDVVRTMLGQAGYTLHDPLIPRPSGGFLPTESPLSSATYCSGSTTMATFALVDSAQDPHVVAVHLLDGEAGRQNCAPQRERPNSGRFPVTVPTLSPPKGALWFGGGSNWSGSSGNLESTLRTTMSTDSVLSNYVSQLVARGWIAEGRPTIGDGTAVQRFSFREGTAPWTATLIVVAVGDRREVLLHLARAE
jgi:hypothetical protein